VRQDGPDARRERPGAGALLVVGVTLALGPLGAVALAGALDGFTLLGAPAGEVFGQLVAPAAFALLVVAYAAVESGRERRRGSGGA
jgi:putative solute:sodium symporter small subunit